MKGQFALFDLLLIVGLAQGLITGTLLLTTKKNSVSNKFLALALIAFCLLCIKMLTYSLGLKRDPLFGYFPIGVELVIAPLMYLYVISLITPAFKLTWKDLPHFIPFICSQSLSFYVFFLTYGGSSMEEKDLVAGSLYFNPIKHIEDYLVLVSIAVYVFAAFLKLQKYRQWLKNSISDSTYPSFSWLRNIMILSLVLGIFLLVNLSADYLFNLKATHMFHWQAYYIFISCLIYYLGFAGYMQPNYVLATSYHFSVKNKIEKLSDHRVVEVTSALEKALQIDKVFLNPTLSAKDLAKYLGISQSNLSYVVNTSMKKNFRDLINDYRIEEVKIKLKDGSLKHISILGIALESGFNSEASFYRVFKKSTGISPAEYMHQGGNL